MAWLSPFNLPMSDWRGKRVWLVGASSGIGLACAQTLHKAGAQVCVSARQAPLLQNFVDTHPGSVALPLDVTDAQALHQAVRSLQVLGSIDMVVYCAGYYTAQTANAYDVHSMQTHLSVNYTGALLMLDAVLPVLLA